MNRFPMMVVDLNRIVTGRVNPSAFLWRIPVPQFLRR